MPSRSLVIRSAVVCLSALLALGGVSFTSVDGDHSTVLRNPPGAPLHVLTQSEVHKFTLANHSGGMYAVIDQVNYTDKAMGVLFLEQEHFGLPTFGYNTYGGIGIEQFIPEDQAYIKNWVAQHLPDQVKPVALTPGGIYVATAKVAFTRYESCYMLDLSGVLKGKTIVSFSNGACGQAALCSDGTLVAWGDNTVYGTRGSHLQGEGHFSFVPVLVDTSGALKGKRVVALDDGALCDDGTFYIWKGVNGQPEQIDNDLLRQKKITAVHGTWFFCSDGTMVESGRRFKDATRGSLQTPVLDQGVLKGKTITSIIRVVTPNAAKSTAIKQPIEPLVEWVALCSDGTLAHWLAPKLNTTDFRPIPPLAPPSAFTFPDSLGVLRGKTITTLADGEEALALCSDGTLVAWKKVAPPAKGRGRLPQMAENNVPSVTENKAQNAPVAGVDYPIVVSGTDLLKGKQVTHIFDDGLIACADGTLIRWRGQGAPFSVDHNQALRGKTILMLDRNIALFQEPDPAKNPADTTADAPASSTPAPLPQ